MSQYNEAKVEILELILEMGEATSRDISKTTDRTMENAGMLLLTYHRYGLLTRYRGSEGYVYSLSQRGIERLAWLQS